MCNDKCPSCGGEIQPFVSVDICRDDVATGQISGYQVQQEMSGEWKNIVAQDGEPQTFTSPLEAALDLANHLDMMASAGMEYSAEEYRIKAV